jgi:acetyl-CoA carboxylase carboxyl transferase subunit alpha
MKLTAADLLELEVIDEVIPEPVGGAHRDYHGAAATLKKAIVRHLTELQTVPEERLVSERYQKFRRMGTFVEG